MRFGNESPRQCTHWRGNDKLFGFCRHNKLLQQFLRQRHQAADAYADVHHLPRHVAGHPPAQPCADPQPRQYAHNAHPGHRQQLRAEVAPHRPHGKVDEIRHHEQELHVPHIRLLVSGNSHEIQRHHGAADGERPGAASGECAAHQPSRQAGLHLYPLGEEQKVRRQRHQERPEQRRQHVQVEPPQQVDDHQAAHRVHADGQRDLLYVDVFAVHPPHDAGLRHADQRHDAGRDGHIVKSAGRHHQHHRRAEARQRLDNAAHQCRQSHHYVRQIASPFPFVYRALYQPFREKATCVKHPRRCAPGVLCFILPVVLAKGVVGVELPVVLRTRREKADALGLFDLLEEGDVALGDVGQQPDIQDAQRQAGQQPPADEAQIQHEQLPLEAGGLRLAHVDGLHDADLRILAQVQDGEAVAVRRHDAGDDEQQRPQEDEDVLYDGQQDDLPGEGEAVEQGDVGHLLAPADAQMIQGHARLQHHIQQGADNGHEQHHQRGERPVQRQKAQVDAVLHGVEVGELVVHVHVVADAADDQRYSQHQQSKQVGVDPRGLEQSLGLLFQGSAIENHTKHHPSGILLHTL